MILLQRNFFLDVTTNKFLNDILILQLSPLLLDLFLGAIDWHVGGRVRRLAPPNQIENQVINGLGRGDDVEGRW